MGIIKRTKSGKAIQLVTDSGEVYQVSVSYLELYLKEGWKHPKVITKLPFMVSPDRFPKSPIFGEVVGSNDNSIDAYSQKFRKENEQAAAFEDKLIEWNDI